MPQTDKTKYIVQTIHAMIHGITIGFVKVTGHILEKTVEIIDIEVTPNAMVSNEIGERQSAINTILSSNSETLVYLSAICQALDWIAAGIPTKPLSITNKTIENKIDFDKNNRNAYLSLFGFDTTENHVLWYRNPPMFQLDHSVQGTKHDTLGYVSWSYIPYHYRSDKE